MDEKDNRDATYYRKLRTKIVLIIIIIPAIAPLVIISAITRHYFQVSYREKVENLSKSLISKHKLMIEHFLIRARGSASCGRHVAYLSGLVQAGVPRATSRCAQVSKYGSSIVDLGVVNDQGIQVAYAGPFKLQGANYSEALGSKRPATVSII